MDTNKLNELAKKHEMTWMRLNGPGGACMFTDFNNFYHYSKELIEICSELADNAVEGQKPSDVIKNYFNNNE